jgi:hypothetical protein
VEAIDGHPIADVRTALDPLIPRDNDQTVRLLTPRFLLMPQVLRGLGLAEAGPVPLTIAMPGNGPRVVDVAPISMRDYNVWAGVYGLHLPGDPDVRWLSRIGDALWWEMLPDDETLYVQHNRVDRLSASTYADLGDALRADGVERTILDLRHNFGGEVQGIDPVLQAFDGSPVDRPDALFVLTGRNTFSAASMFAARLERDTEATFVGEPTGGCPTVYGDSEAVRLRWTGIEASIASEVSVGVDPDDPRTTIDVDAPAEPTLEDWLGGRDPAIDAILGLGLAP